MRINNISAFGVQKNQNKNTFKSNQAFKSNPVDFNYSSLNNSDILGVSKRAALDNFSTPVLNMLALNNKLYFELGKNAPQNSGLEGAIESLKEGQREANKFSAVFNSSLMNENKMLLLDAALFARAQGEVESKPVKIKGGKYYTSSYFEDGNLAILKIKSQKDGSEAEFVDYLSKDKTMQHFPLKSVKKGNLKAYIGDIPQEVAKVEVFDGEKAFIYKKENVDGSFSINSQIKNLEPNKEDEAKKETLKKPDEASFEAKAQNKNDKKDDENDYFGIPLNVLASSVPSRDIIGRQNALKMVLSHLNHPKGELDTSTLTNKYAKEEIERAQNEIVPYLASALEYSQMFINQFLAGIGFDTDSSATAKGLLELAKIAKRENKEKSEAVEIGNKKFYSYLESDNGCDYLTIKSEDGDLEARYKKVENVLSQEDTYTLAEVAFSYLRVFCDLVSKEPKEIMANYQKNDDGSYSAEFFASKEYEKVRSPKIHVLEDCEVKYSTNFLGMTEKKFKKRDTIFSISQNTGLVDQYQSKKATQFGFESHFEFDQYDGKWKFKLHKRTEK